jgi:DNA-binding NtrC family response regulator
MEHSVRILSASVDANLNRSRALVLREHGFEVIASESVDEAREHMKQQSFDVIIFGSTLPRDTCWTLAGVFRNRNPKGTIIEILPSPWAAPKNNPDVTLVSCDDPSELVAVIRERAA